MSSAFAPCIAIVGPANSGKTTLINLLDHELQHHAEQPAIHVVKGNPDGTGRYLLHAPEAREALKPEVKGTWISTTAATICAWIANSRAHLELVLVDLGGEHDDANDYILQHCSHSLVLSRRFEDADEEAGKGAESWGGVCRRNGLRPLAHLTSILGAGQPEVRLSASGVLEGTFRGDAGAPADLLNRAVIDELVGALLSLRVQRPQPCYLSLKLTRDWRLDDLAELGGRGADLDRMAASGSVALFGRAPLWAYLAALARVLERAPAVRLRVFDPKVVCGLVEIPAAPVPDAGSPLARAVDVRWAASPDATGGAALRLKIVTGDGFLWPMSFECLPAAPLPPMPPPAGPLWLDGAAPIWLHLTYARWLLVRHGVRALGVRDIRMRGVVFPFGPDSPRIEPRGQLVD